MDWINEPKTDYTDVSLDKCTLTLLGTCVVTGMLCGNLCFIYAD